jgi:adenylate kinase family enzyme
MAWRISVIGTAGCGKTTLSRELSRRLKIPHVELDAFNWGPNWTFVPNATFLERVDAALEQENWVMDGNYIRVRFDIWSRATHIVWLDYPRWRVMQQVTIRSIGRILRREELWAGNRKPFKSRSSVKSPLFGLPGRAIPARRKIMSSCWACHCLGIRKL